MSEVPLSRVAERAVAPFPSDRVQLLLVRDHAVLVHSGTLENLLANLIQNALEAGAEHVLLRVEGPQIAVEDDGPGFDPDALVAGRSTKAFGLGRTLTEVLPRFGRIYGVAHAIESGDWGSRVRLDFLESTPVPATGARPGPREGLATH